MYVHMSGKSYLLAGKERKRGSAYMVEGEEDYAVANNT